MCTLTVEISINENAKLLAFSFYPTNKPETVTEYTVSGDKVLVEEYKENIVVEKHVLTGKRRFSFLDKEGGALSIVDTAGSYMCKCTIHKPILFYLQTRYFKKFNTDFFYRKYNIEEITILDHTASNINIDLAVYDYPYDVIIYSDSKKTHIKKKDGADEKQMLM